MARTDNFNKFVKKPKSGAVKEKFKQEKKKEKKERSEAIEQHYAKKREERMLLNQQPTSSSGKSVTGNKYAKGKPVAGSYSERSNAGQRPDRNKKFDKNKPGKPSFDRPTNTDQKPGKPNRFDKKRTIVPDREESFKAEKVQEQPVYSNKKDAGKESAKKSSYSSYRDNQVDKTNKFYKEKSAEEKFDVPAKDKKKSDRKSPVINKKDKGKPARAFKEKRTFEIPKEENTGNQFKEKSKPASVQGNAKVAIGKNKSAADYEIMPLNKYIAHSGVCARRDAALIVKEGKVKVNGAVVTDPGTKVSTNDIIEVNGTKVTPSKNFVYILLNKPKDYITTSDDPQGRRTVLDLVRHATEERIYPVGRLDRNTSGVLLLTNDGDLSQKLSHPSHEVKKVYEVKLDRALTKGDMEKIAAGVTLEDGLVSPDAIAYADSMDKSIIGIEIHSGRNRIVRRIFEHMKYDVKGLDRVMFAGLTKKDVQRGKWRFLKEKEVRILKFMNKSFVKTREVER